MAQGYHCPLISHQFRGLKARRPEIGAQMWASMTVQLPLDGKLVSCGPEDLYVEAMWTKDFPWEMGRLRGVEGTWE